MGAEYSQAAKKGWATRRKNGRVPTREQYAEWGAQGGRGRPKPRVKEVLDKSI